MKRRSYEYVSRTAAYNINVLNIPHRWTRQSINKKQSKTMSDLPKLNTGHEACHADLQKFVDDMDQFILKDEKEIVQS